tara:strand:- start:891 stop:1004 length:114 start_codon:yes stop_codon:yes gene_type:complete
MSIYDKRKSKNEKRLKSKHRVYKKGGRNRSIKIKERD